MNSNRLALASRAIFFILITIHFTLSSTTLTLKQYPDIIHSHVTKSVTLECSDNQSNNVHVTWIRILKFENRTWTLFAELRDTDHCVSTERGGDEPGVLLSGYVGLADESYLRITWLVANEKTLGKYKCDAVMMTSGQELIIQTTSHYTIVEGNLLASDVVGMIQEVEADFQRKLDSERKYVESAFAILINKLDLFSGELKNLIQGQTELFRHIENTLYDVNGQQRSRPKDIGRENLRKQEREGKENGEERNQTAVLDIGNWPAGNYGLLMPNSGCPKNTSNVTWLAVMQEHTINPKSSNDFLNVSNPSHMSLPLVGEKQSKTVLYERLCQVNTNLQSIAQEMTWPQGSYCINRGEDSVDGRRHECPERFQSGYIRIEDSTHLTQTYLFSKLFKTIQTDGRSSLDFCCIDDQSDSNLLYLPTSSPFYLYRYQGECPQVYGMTLTEEFITLDIGREGINWRYDNVNHPDMSSQDFTLQLCHYTRI